MADDAHKCRSCGYDDREGDVKNEQKLDFGDNPSTESMKSFLTEKW